MAGECMMGDNEGGGVLESALLCLGVGVALFVEGVALAVELTL